MTTRSALIAAYVGSIIAANLLTNSVGMVNLGLITVTAGTFTAGFALVLRDGVQRTAGKRVVLAAILAGAALSAFTSSPALALASGIAFLVSELVDLVVYTPLAHNLPRAVLASSVISAPVDTVLFLHIAGFPLTWQAISGQFIVKTVIAAIVAWRIACSTSQAA